MVIERTPADAEQEAELIRVKEQSEQYRSMIESYQTELRTMKNMVSAKDYADMVSEKFALQQQNKQMEHKIAWLAGERDSWEEQFSRLSAETTAALQNYNELLMQSQMPQSQTPQVWPPRPSMPRLSGPARSNSAASTPQGRGFITAEDGTPSIAA